MIELSWSQQHPNLSKSLENFIRSTDLKARQCKIQLLLHIRDNIWFLDMFPEALQTRLPLECIYAINNLVQGTFNDA
jgi:hypothetical protein